MAKKGKLTAHNLIRPALEGLLERARSAADRVTRDHDDGEAVHDFRVALRRLRTILRASRGVYGKAAVSALEAVAKQLGDATSLLRDAEVLEDTLHAAILDNQARAAAATWLAEVHAAEGALRDAAVARLMGPELDEMCRATRRMLARGPKRVRLVDDYAERVHAANLAGVVELLPVDEGDVERLHRLRIRFKRLRYASELLAQFMTVIDATGSGKKQRARALETATRFSAIARQAARMQKELGLLHDADQALLALEGALLLADAERNAIATALGDLRRRLVQRSLAQLVKLPPEIVGAEPVAKATVVGTPRLVRP